MIEKFSCGSAPKVYRRKTLTFGQKILLYVIILAACSLSILVVMALGNNPDTMPLVFISAILAPPVIAIALMIAIAMHPKGPEHYFVMPTYSDESGCSKIAGRILRADGVTTNVEVTVPNVYNVAFEIGSNPASSTSSGLSTPEMFEMALDEIRERYAGAEWDGEPQIIDAAA
jgi:hypothetical protein